VAHLAVRRFQRRVLVVVTMSKSARPSGRAERIPVTKLRAILISMAFLVGCGGYGALVDPRANSEAELTS
jgi:hypothetical protein